MDSIIKKTKSWIPAVLAIVILYIFYSVVGIGCPIRFATGISCPGCGMTRAWIALLRLDFSAAFHDHPLVLLPAVWCILYGIKEKMPYRWYKIFLWITIALFLLVWGIRIMDPADTIVEFRPQKGLIGRVLKKITEWL